MGETRKGGARPGAGRKPTEPTKVVRLPLPFATIAKRLKDGTLRAGDINAFLNLTTEGAKAAVPLVSCSAACGFPSPADDHLDRPLDFNELLIKNPAATFAVRIAGESMIQAGLFPNDIAIVNRAAQPVSGCIVLALVEGEFTIKRYRKTARGVVLKAENSAFKDIVIGPDTDFQVWGVITNSIRML